MNSRIFRTVMAMPPKARLPFFTALAFALLLLLAANGYAESPSVASLKGTYVFHLAEAKLAYWSNSKPCPGNGHPFTAYASNQETYTELVYGVVTFDGAGHISSLKFTDTGRFDQNESNATIKITCSGNGFTNTGGNIVYDAAQTGSTTGSYQIESSATPNTYCTDSNTTCAQMTFSVPSDTGEQSVTIGMDLTAFGSNGVASTVLLRNLDGDTNKRWMTGIAVHE